MHGLYAITPEQSDDRRLLADIEAALSGGCRWLQYRDKTSCSERHHARAVAIAARCREHGAGLIINDDIQLALAVNAAGVHLGRDDSDIAAARAVLGNRRLIGASCYDDFARAQAAEAAGANYVAFGAVFASETKPEAVRAPLELFARARAKLALPLCAIGGITLANAPEVIAAGADLLAVITDLFSAPDIAARAGAFQQLFEDCPV